MTSLIDDVINDLFKFFPAVVKSIITDKMQYEVEWEDGSNENLFHRFSL